MFSAVAICRCCGSAQSRARRRCEDGTKHTHSIRFFVHNYWHEMHTLGLSAGSIGASGSDFFVVMTGFTGVAVAAGASICCARMLMVVSATTGAIVGRTGTVCVSFATTDDGVTETGDGVALTVENPSGLLVGICDGVNGVVSMTTGDGASSVSGTDSIIVGAAAAALIAPNPRLPVSADLFTVVVDCSAVCRGFICK